MPQDPISNMGLNLLDRRNFLAHTGTGLSAMALSHLLQQNGYANPDPIHPNINPKDPLAARPSHFEPKAKQVVMLFCSGACSQLDTWDYKPDLVKYHDTPMPNSENMVTFQGENGNLNQSPFPFKPYGDSGKMCSGLLPHINELVDDICFIHSMKGDNNTHGPGENFMSTGYVMDGFPSIGSWVTYALGSECDDLPAYVAIPDPRGVPQSSVNNWGNGFLPAVMQGTPMNALKPVYNLQRPDGIPKSTDAATKDFLHWMNEKHLEKFPGDSELSARIASYELAAKMQLSVPEVSDLSTEPESIIKMYGADDPDPIKAGFAKNCILARRLIEKGVRFVQLFNGGYAMGEGVGNWDGHRFLEKQYSVHAQILDQPAAALLKDLKLRGLLDETLFVWTTEFGRMPTFQKGASGRDHNPDGFTSWMAGAGVKPGFSYGETDNFGHKSVTDICHVHDFHATILHLLGLNHKQLTYYHNGLDRRLTDVSGEVVRQILV